MKTFIFILFCTISSSALAARIAVVYHSGYGHTEVIAKAVYKGTLEIKGTESKLIKVNPEGKIPEESWQILEKSDAIIFGAPTYMGSLSGPFKMFIDTTSKIFFEQKWKNKVAGGFTNSGGLSGDKLSSILELVVLAGQHGMIWVSPGILPESPYAPENINRLGSYLGVMAQSNQGAPETTTASGDIKTSELYGKHIAEITEKLVK
jgi:multimeric flavodoxin WrbA